MNPILNNNESQITRQGANEMSNYQNSRGEISLSAWFEMQFFNPQAVETDIANLAAVQINTYVLPHEAFERIVIYLDDQTVFTVTLVSKAWSESALVFGAKTREKLLLKKIMQIACNSCLTKEKNLNQLAIEAVNSSGALIDLKNNALNFLHTSLSNLTAHQSESIRHFIFPHLQTFLPIVQIKVAARKLKELKDLGIPDHYELYEKVDHDIRSELVTMGSEINKLVQLGAFAELKNLYIELAQTLPEEDTFGLIAYIFQWENERKAIEFLKDLMTNLNCVHGRPLKLIMVSELELLYRMGHTDQAVTFAQSIFSDFERDAVLMKLSMTICGYKFDSYYSLEMIFKIIPKISSNLIRLECIMFILDHMDELNKKEISTLQAYLLDILKQYTLLKSHNLNVLKRANMLIQFYTLLEQKETEELGRLFVEDLEFRKLLRPKRDSFQNIMYCILLAGGEDKVVHLINVMLCKWKLDTRYALYANLEALIQRLSKDGQHQKAIVYQKTLLKHKSS